MPRKKIITPKTPAEIGAGVARRALRDVAFTKSDAVVEVEWSMDGTLMFADGNYVTFVNKIAKINSKYLAEAQEHGCTVVSREAGL